MFTYLPTTADASFDASHIAMGVTGYRLPPLPATPFLHLGTEAVVPTTLPDEPVRVAVYTTEDYKLHAVHIELVEQDDPRVYGAVPVPSWLDLQIPEAVGSNGELRTIGALVWEDWEVRIETNSNVELSFAAPSERGVLPVDVITHRGRVTAVVLNTSLAYGVRMTESGSICACGECE